MSSKLDSIIACAQAGDPRAIHALYEAIHQLPRAQQHVITLKFFVGMSTLEIAASLGRTEGAIKALQARALHQLHHLLVR